MQASDRRGFTLVELLVVIGIIALLIAILMPALSRARKQALQVSCGSNERQVTYAMLAYANDWKEQFPTQKGAELGVGGGAPVGLLMHMWRLPIIGFDTVTIYDWWSYTHTGYYGNNSMLGGFAFVMRDYLKNDFDIYVCPDGWYTRGEMLGRWNGAWQDLYRGPATVCTGVGGWDCEGIQNYRTGYLWLPHRVQTGTGGIVGLTMQDQPGDTPKTASDLPSLLVIADFNYWADRWYPDCNGTSNAAGGVGLAANHIASSYKQLPLLESNCMVQVFPPNIGRQENPLQLPLGQNVARIDARTSWVAFQDWKYGRWSNGFAHHSF